MKTNRLLCTTLLLLGATFRVVQAQDFRSLPPAQQPNAAELAYLGNAHPNPIRYEQADQAAIALVTDFLNDLTSGQLEAAHKRMAAGFTAYGPGYNDKLETDNLLNQWERDGQLFADQHLTVVSSSVTTVAAGDNRGTWVYLKMVWSATERSVPGKAVRIPFHQLARVNNGQIERTYTSYGNDQLFYDLGFALYTSPSGVVQRR